LAAKWNLEREARVDGAGKSFALANQRDLFFWLGKAARAFVLSRKISSQQTFISLLLTLFCVFVLI
jgi:hypothetical protein